MIPYTALPTVAIGPVKIGTFGAIVASAVFLGLEIGKRRFRRFGLDPVVGDRLAWWTIIGGFIGAHLFSVLLYFPKEVARDPLLLLRFWEDISSFGGMLGGLVGLWLFLKLHARELDRGERWKYIDVAAFVFPFSLAVGRIACSLVHDHPGTVTSFPLAVSLVRPEARALIASAYASAGRVAELSPTPALASLGFHDLGFYEFLYLALVVVPITLLLDRRVRRPGFFLASFVVLYMPVRFALDFLRVSDVRYLGFTPGQYVAVASILWLSVAVLRRRLPRQSVGGSDSDVSQPQTP